MNNLTTRKIVLGMLVTFVLAFSVLGNLADAQVTITESSGDHQVQWPGLRFAKSLVFSAKGVKADDTEEDTFTEPITSLITITVTDTDGTSASGVVINSITISGKTAYVGSGGLFEPADYTYDPGHENKLDETEKEAKKAEDKKESDYNSLTNTLKKGTNTISVVCTASTAGVHQVRVFVNGSSAPQQIFTLYVATDSIASPDISEPSANEIKTGRPGSPIAVTSSAGNGALIDFTVVSGSGKLYIDDMNKVQSTQTIGLDDDTASVYLKPPSSGITIVEMRVSGKAVARYCTFFSDYPNLVKVEEPSIDSRTAPVGTRLPDPFIFEVRDGTRSVRIPADLVSHGLMQVDLSLDTDAGVSFDTVSGSIPIEAQLDIDGTTRSASSVSENSSISMSDVNVDTSGRIAAYVTFGSNGTTDDWTDAGSYTLTGTFEGVSVACYARATDGLEAAIIEKVSGDKQRVDPESGAHPSKLVIRVLNSDRQIIRNTPVRFYATVGVVTGPMMSGQLINETTDENGEVSVAFVIGDTSGNAEVTGIINPNTQHEKQVIFTIYGRGGAPTPDPTPDPGPIPDPVTIIREVSPPEPRLIIEPSTLTGGPGSTYKLTIRAVDASGIAVSVPRVAVSNLAFIQAGGQVSPVTITAPITANVTLPSTPGQYKLSAAATGYQDATVDITVAAGTLSVLIDPVGGAPGTRSTVTVTATNAGGRTRNVSVTLGITTGGGTLSPSLVTTNTNGTAISILTRGRALGDNYFVTATADGYTQRSVLAAGERVVISETQISATGSTPPAQPGASGVAAELNVDDGNQQVGSLNSRLAEPLVVEVLDANDNPVENARVRFRTTIGSGRFSPRTPRTDEDGFAETTFTPTSTGRIRVVATVAGADSTAAFIVQGGEPADALVKVSGDNQSGTPGNALAAPFVVEVQDEDGEPLTGHSVTFSVTAGGGSLSAKQVPQRTQTDAHRRRSRSAAHPVSTAFRQVYRAWIP